MASLSAERELVSRRGLGTVLEVLTPTAAVIALWLWTSQAGSFFFPPLAEVLSAFREDWLFGRVASDLLPSLRRMATGWVIAFVLGVILGVLIGLSPTARRVTSPFVEFIRAVPSAALIPFVIVAFGFSDLGKVFLIAQACVPFVLLNAIDGVRGTDPLYRETSRVYGIGWWREFRWVILPAALPRIFAGVRLSLVVALLAMVLSEFVASTNGVGFVIVQAQQSFALPRMWAGIMLLGILGYLINVLAVAVERRALPWHQGVRASR